jgi:hypothetical protein
MDGLDADRLSTRAAIGIEREDEGLCPMPEVQSVAWMRAGQLTFHPANEQ